MSEVTQTVSLSQRARWSAHLNGCDLAHLLAVLIWGCRCLTIPNLGSMPNPGLQSLLFFWMEAAQWGGEALAVESSAYYNLSSSVIPWLQGSHLSKGKDQKAKKAFPEGCHSAQHGLASALSNPYKLYKLLSVMLMACATYLQIGRYAT